MSSKNRASCRLAPVAKKRQPPSGHPCIIIIVILAWVALSEVWWDAHARYAEPHDYAGAASSYPKARTLQSARAAQGDVPSCGGLVDVNRVGEEATKGPHMKTTVRSTLKPHT